MTSREHAAFAAGIEAARQMALTAAVTIEICDDAGAVRQQAAVAALQGLAEGPQEMMTGTPSTCISAAFSGQHVEREAIDGTYDGRVLG